MKIIETRPREIFFALWDHCQNLLNDPRNCNKIISHGMAKIHQFKDICGYFQCAPFPRLQTGKVVWVLSFDP